MRPAAAAFRVSFSTLVIIEFRLIVRDCSGHVAIFTRLPEGPQRWFNVFLLSSLVQSQCRPIVAPACVERCKVVTSLGECLSCMRQLYELQWGLTRTAHCYSIWCHLHCLCHYFFFILPLLEEADGDRRSYVSKRQPFFFPPLVLDLCTNAHVHTVSIALTIQIQQC